MVSNSQGYVIGIGNPIIDISNVSDKETVEKFGLKPGDTVFADDKNKGFFDVLEADKNVSYVPGGSVTNSIRVTNVSFS